MTASTLPCAWIYSAARISEDDLRALELEMGYGLPANFKKHYLTINGGRPHCCYWTRDNTVFYEIESFLPLKYHSPPPLDVPHFGVIEEVRRQFVGAGRFAPHFLPFARDWDGNFFCLDVRRDDVYLYPLDNWLESHDLPTDFYTHCPIFLMNGFELFTKMLIA